MEVNRTIILMSIEDMHGKWSKQEGYSALSGENLEYTYGNWKRTCTMTTAPSPLLPCHTYPAILPSAVDGATKAR
jgi:hypothetical protein